MTKLREHWGGVVLAISFVGAVFAGQAQIADNKIDIKDLQRDSKTLIRVDTRQEIVLEDLREIKHTLKVIQGKL